MQHSLKLTGATQATKEIEFVPKHLIYLAQLLEQYLGQVTYINKLSIHILKKATAITAVTACCPNTSLSFSF